MRPVGQLKRMLNQFLIFVMLLALTFAFDETLVDQVYFPKILLFALSLVLFMLVNIHLTIAVLKKSKTLQLSGLWLFCLLVMSWGSGTWYLGESQRLNGLIFFVCVVLSLIFGAIIWRSNLTRPFVFYVSFIGFCSATLVIVGQTSEINENYQLGGWLRVQSEGGINDNFKSMFISISFLCMLLFLRETKTKLHLIISILGATVQMTSILIIGNLQGIALIAASAIFYVTLVLRRAWMMVPLIAAALGSYIFVVWRRPSLFIQDSAIHERLLLARKSFEYLEDAPLFRPEFIRVSTLDFSDVTLTNSPGIKFWIDDVHNFYLQLANTIGIVFTITFVSFFVVLVFVASRRIKQSEKIYFSAGLLAICAAYGCTLLITMGTMFYAFIVFTIFGILLEMTSPREDSLKRESRMLLKKPGGAEFDSKIFPFVSAFAIAFVTVVTASFTVRDFVSQNRFLGALRQYNPEEFTLTGWEKERPSLERSNDLRFLYETTRFLVNSSACEPANQVASMMKEKAPNHFLAREADDFSKSCTPTP